MQRVRMSAREGDVSRLICAAILEMVTQARPMRHIGEAKEDKRRRTLCATTQYLSRSPNAIARPMFPPARKM